MTIISNKKGLSRKQIAWRIAQEIPDGSYVNLGIGSPELVANYIPEGKEIIFHSENGVLNYGSLAELGEEDEGEGEACQEVSRREPGAASEPSDEGPNHGARGGHRWKSVPA